MLQGLVTKFPQQCGMVQQVTALLRERSHKELRRKKYMLDVRVKEERRIGSKNVDRMVVIYLANLFWILEEVELVFEVLKLGCLNHLAEWPCMLI